jgi:hypothetical protein
MRAMRPRSLRAEVDEHVVLRSLLRAAAQLLREAIVVLGARAARTGARDRPVLDQAPTHRHEPLGRRTDQGQVVAREEEHVWRGIGDAQHAVKRERIAAETLLEALRQHGLEDLALRDLVAQAPHAVEEARARDGRLPSRLRARACRSSAGRTARRRRARRSRPALDVALRAGLAGADDVQELRRVVEGHDLVEAIERRRSASPHGSSAASGTRGSSSRAHS